MIGLDEDRMEAASDFLNDNATETDAFQELEGEHKALLAAWDEMIEFLNVSTRQDQYHSDTRAIYSYIYGSMIGIGIKHGICSVKV